MEKHLNWNVYKIFKNGKRAKAPMTSFEYNDESNVAAYFEAEIKKNFSEKIRDLNFSILRGDAPQEREEEETNKMEEDALKKQTLILSRFLKKTGVTTKYRVVGGLIFAKATNWKWQWCALECGTNQFIAGLSPPFDNYEGAQEWMNREVRNLK
tara:strand:- start:34 stop:495 length:462 start_codon:yes stop_codon:yes gene_type:complete